VLERVLRLPATLPAQVLARRLIALDEALGYRPTFETVVDALVRGFEQTWPISLVRGELTAAEQQRAAELVRDKFGHAAWTHRR
jgi:lipoate-protein ligase A